MMHAHGNAVAVVYDVLAKLITPSMAITRDWGDLPKSEMGREIKKTFLGDFEAFVNFLQSIIPLITKVFIFLLTVSTLQRQNLILMEW